MVFTPVFQTPAERLDYAIDWDGENLLEAGETISTSVWDVPDDMTGSSESKTATTTTIWLTGGTAGEDYEVVNTITTSAGRVYEKTLNIHVRANL